MYHNFIQLAAFLHVDRKAPVNHLQGVTVKMETEIAECEAQAQYSLLS